MEQTVYTDIWTHLKQSVDLTLVLVIIATGYLVARSGILPRFLNKLSTGLKVLIATLPAAITYGILDGLEPGVITASFLIAFGFHGVILKRIDDLFKDSGAIGKHLGPRPKKPPRT